MINCGWLNQLVRALQTKCLRNCSFSKWIDTNENSIALRKFCASKNCILFWLNWVLFSSQATLLRLALKNAFYCPRAKVGNVFSFFSQKTKHSVSLPSCSLSLPTCLLNYLCVCVCVLLFNMYICMHANGVCTWAELFFLVRFYAAFICKLRFACCIFYYTLSPLPFPPRGISICIVSHSWWVLSNICVIFLKNCSKICRHLTEKPQMDWLMTAAELQVMRI